MLQWIGKLAEESKHCSTSTYYLSCALFLNSWGKKVAVVNPRYVYDLAKAMGYKNKTDLSDAQVLAHFGEVKQSAYWQPPTKKIVQLRCLVKRREELVVMLCGKGLPTLIISRYHPQLPTCLCLIEPLYRCGMWCVLY